VFVMKNRVGFLVLALTLLAAPSAMAESVEAKARAARTACLSGDFAKGVALLSGLFVKTKSPNHIYNQGRCFEQNRRYDDAIARFQEYLRIGKNLSPDEKADAEKHIADCKELLASQAGIAPAPTPAQPLPTPAPSPPVAPPPVFVPSAPAAFAPPVVQPAAQVEVPAAMPGGQPGAGLKTAGIVTAAVGGAAVIAGVLLNLKANSLVDELQKPDGYSPDKASQRDSYATLSWVGYGVGAACVATGAVLFILGWRAGGSASQVSLAPVLAPGQGGIALEGAF
jgi:hypothetical protein